jgi:hypothetical protein
MKYITPAAAAPGPFESAGIIRFVAAEITAASWRLRVIRASAIPEYAVSSVWSAASALVFVEVVVLVTVEVTGGEVTVAVVVEVTGGEVTVAVDVTGTSDVEVCTDVVVEVTEGFAA